MKRFASVLSFLLALAPVAFADDFGDFSAAKFQKGASAESGGADERSAAKDVVAKQIKKIADAKAQGKALLGDPAKDAGQRMAAIDACDPQAANIGKDPDDGGSITCGGDMYEVMTFGKGSTDRNANSGTIKYNRQAVLSNRALYESAFLFYRDLKDLDLASRGAPGDASGASIEAKASKNLLQLARESVKKATGKDNRLLAMKVLAIYGHDNRFNFLSVNAGANGNSCRLKLLDAMKPNANSSLYLNGAAAREYWEDDVNKAVEINRDCLSATSGRIVERDMCGEYTKYQADYYHVITSAFLNCRCLARGSSVVQDITGGLQRDAYLWMVAKYKSNRFDEEIAAAMKNAGRTPSVALLDKAWKEKAGLGANGSWKLVCDSAKASTCLTRAAVDSWDWKGWCGAIAGCNEPDIAPAKALLKRYAFEMNFRVVQHFTGILIANFDLKCEK